MATVISALPLVDNDGNSTQEARQSVLDNFPNAFTEEALGLWYDDSRLYEEPVLFVVLQGDREKIRSALCQFGREARQLAVLMVEDKCTGAHVQDTARGRDGASRLAAKFGGATLFKSGLAVAYTYAAVEAGKDY